MDRDRLVSPTEIQALVADGQLIVIHEGNALKLDGWINKHPGGHLVIHHMVGRDATDEINVYHFAKTLRQMKAYRIGRVDLPWVNLIPPIRIGTGSDKNQADVTKANPGPKELGTSKAVDVTIQELNQTNDAEGATSGNICIVESGKCTRRAAPTPTSTETCNVEDTQDSEKSSLIQEAHTYNPSEHSRASYIEALENKEIADGISGFPSVDAETQLAITLEYRALHQRVKDQGLYQCRYSEYGNELVRCALIFAVFISLLRAEWYLTSSIFLGIFWQQIMFTAHDSGHRGITGNFVCDTLIGAFVADFCCGLSIGWWKSSHNVHHLITNMPEHDPDLQNVPLFATAPSYMKSMFSSFYQFTFVWNKVAEITVPYQKYSYYPIMAVARFNLYMLSWLHLLSPRASQLGSAWWTRYVEIVFMAGYWALFGYALVWRTLPNWPIRIAFVMSSHAFTMLLHVQITLSHWGMPTADLGPTESFPQRQLRTTMDISCPPWLDWLHGGLHLQAVHHLFPRLPRHNLRMASVLVKEFAAKTKIKYSSYGFVDGNGVMLSRLEEVAKMVETLVKCQLHMAETGDSGLH